MWFHILSLVDTWASRQPQTNPQHTKDIGSCFNSFGKIPRTKNGYFFFFYNLSIFLWLFQRAHAILHYDAGKWWMWASLPCLWLQRERSQFVITEGRINCGLYVYVQVISSFFFFLILSVSSPKMVGRLMNVTTACVSRRNLTSIVPSPAISHLS